MLPIAHLSHRIDPFDRYCTGNCALEESYRAVINTGVKAYQLHTYLDLVQQHFGRQIRHLVRKRQLGLLDGVGKTDRVIEKTLELIMTALGTKAVTIPTHHGEVDVPLEMNVALLLLLDDPQSPDCVSDPARRSVQIGQIGKDVDWCFAQGLTQGREAIADIFVPMFSEGFYLRHSTRVL
jgi:hypothetical protein